MSLCVNLKPTGMLDVNFELKTFRLRDTSLGVAISSRAEIWVLPETPIYDILEKKKRLAASFTMTLLLICSHDGHENP